MESTDHEASALATLHMMEERLHRLEFLLHGSSNAVGISDPAQVPASSDETVCARLFNLERGLHRLSMEHSVVRDVLDAHGRYPEIFHPAVEEQVPRSLDMATITSIVLAHMSTFSEVLSGLSSIKDLSIPPASTSAELAALQPKLDKVRETQEGQIHEVAELRTRSVRLLERWLDVGVVGQGEDWAESEERVRAAEREIRRIEVAREKGER